jgi:hypothetical protein
VGHPAFRVGENAPTALAVALVLGLVRLAPHTRAVPATLVLAQPQDDNLITPGPALFSMPAWWPHARLDTKKNKRKNKNKNKKKKKKKKIDKEEFNAPQGQR